MHIRYNGIDLEVVRLVNLERVPVYSDDQTTYLFTRTTVHVLALINEAATSYQLSAALRAPGGRCERDVGHVPASPVETNIAILQALQQPRRKLVISFDSKRFPANLFGAQIPAPPPEILLECPKPGEEVDSHEGPLPQLFNVNRAIGNRSMMVEWAVVCFVRECDDCNSETYTVPDKNGTRVPKKVFASNRFSMSQTVDGNFATTRVVHGKAVFDSAALRKAGVPTPDVLRSQLGIPVPAGFKREQIEVDLDADGLTVSYAFIDVEKMVSYDDQRFDPKLGKLRPRYVTHVDAVHEQIYSSDPEIISGGLEAVGHLANTGFARQALFGMDDEERHARGLPPKKKTRTGRISSTIFDAGSLIGVATGLASNVMPSYTELVEVDLWGSRYAKKSDLVFLAYSIACGRLVAFPLAEPDLNVFGPVQLSLRLLIPSQIRLSTSMFEKHVSLSMSIKLNGITCVGPIGGIAAPLKDKAVKSLVAPFSETVVGGNLDLYTDLIGGNLPDDGQTIGFPIPADQPAPPHDNQMRGTYLGRLFTQALSESMCDPIPDLDEPPELERPMNEVPL
jgi:hypothetical protein